MLQILRLKSVNSNLRHEEENPFGDDPCIRRSFLPDFVVIRTVLKSENFCCKMWPLWRSVKSSLTLRWAFIPLRSETRILQSRPCLYVWKFFKSLPFNNCSSVIYIYKLFYSNSLSHNKATENEKYELWNVLICIYNLIMWQMNTKGK